MKVAINGCFGGFSLSPEATLKLYERGVTEIATPVSGYWGKDRDDDSILGKTRALREWREYLSGVDKGRGLFITVFSPDEQFVLNAGREITRHHPELIRVIEEMGEKANGGCASLEIVEIPDGVEYVIEEYDGNEHIAEQHRTWR